MTKLQSIAGLFIVPWLLSGFDIDEHRITWAKIHCSPDEDTCISTPRDVERTYGVNDLYTQIPLMQSPTQGKYWPTFDKFMFALPVQTSGIYIYLSTPGIGQWSGIWEYCYWVEGMIEYPRSLWRPLSVYQNKTNYFRAKEGLYAIRWQKPDSSDWIKIGIEPKAGYIVRYRFTDVQNVCTVPTILFALGY